MAGNPVIASPAAAGKTWSGRDLLGLVKGHLSLYIALTAVAGHVLAQNRFSLASLGIGAWVLLLSCGAGVLNNIQDRWIDRDRERTRSRVLAREAMEVIPAAVLASGLVVLALAGLAFSCPSLVPAGIGCASLVFYNAIYTPMKKQGRAGRLWAMVPGTACGMMPPAIGWAAVEKGMAVADPTGLYIVMAGIGVWQFPHFLLVFIKEEMAGSGASAPGMEDAGRYRASLTQVVIWAALFSISMMLLPLKGWLASGVLVDLLFGLALGLPVLLALLFSRKDVSPRSLDLGFWCLNFSMLAYMVIILLDRA